MTYVGHVSEEQARRAWAASDAFVLPSYSEGFSMAVLEALACRLPCLITTACHFPELAGAGGAVVVEPTADDVTRGLRELLERHLGGTRRPRPERPPPHRARLARGPPGPAAGHDLRVDEPAADPPPDCVEC